MTMDDEWPVNTIIMAPPHLVSAMTRSADVTSMGAIAGASYVPGDGDLRQVSENDGRWVLARVTDDIPRILAADLGVLLYVETHDDLGFVLKNDQLDETNFIVAFQITSTATLESAKQAAAAIRGQLVGRKTASSQILVSGSFDHKNLTQYASIPNVNGLLLLDASSDRVVGLLKQIAG